jgi:hypothetical protein
LQGRRPGHDAKLTNLSQLQLMFESLFAAVLPVVKDLLWAAAGMALTYLLNKIQTQFNTI